MSVSLFWQPIKGKVLTCDSPTKTKEILERAFGSFPLTLDVSSYQIIKGMMASDPENEAWQELLSAIDEHRRIMVEAEY